MMGGLAYMTGRPGDPLRAGTSVNDIMGGLFGAIGALGALIQRGVTGRGMEVQSALFENNVFLVGQHMLQFAMTGKQPAPMPARDNPWAVYDVFTVKDGEQIFLAAVSDAQWLTFCDALGFADLKADPALATNNQRVARASRAARRRLRERLADRTRRRARRAVRAGAGLPFAPIRRPEDLYDDPHLVATGGLADVRLPDGDRAGQTVKTTLFPITLRGPAARRAPAIRRRMGEHTRELLRAIGYAPDRDRRPAAQTAWLHDFGAMQPARRSLAMRVHASREATRTTLLRLAALASRRDSRQCGSGPLRADGRARRSSSSCRSRRPRASTRSRARPQPALRRRWGIRWSSRTSPAPAASSARRRS